MSRNSMIKDILTYIEKNLENDLTLDKIAKELNFSKYYIERVFSKNIEKQDYFIRNQAV